MKSKHPRQSSGSPRTLSSPMMMALEPRIMFDGAAIATAADIAHTDAKPTDIAAPEHHLAPPPAAVHTVDLPVPATPVTVETTKPATEIVFIDGNLPDVQQLKEGVKAGVEVVILDPTHNGLNQIADYLEGRAGIDAIHIVSHGQQGEITLGTFDLNQTSIAQQADTLSRIGNSLGADGDILLYGCQVGAGEVGNTFITQLASLTQADVAASLDNTGNTSLLANWNLEKSAGTIDHDTPFTAELLADYQHVLPTTLAAGDIAVIGINTDGVNTTQTWAFVPLVELTAGTVIHFTDDSITENGVFLSTVTAVTNEGHMTWTVPSTIAAGTVFVVTNDNDSSGGYQASIVDLSGTSYGGVSGTVGGTASGFNTSGEQIFIYQGTAGTTVGATFIYGLNTAQSSVNTGIGGWVNSASLTSASFQTVSYRPAGLTDGTSAAVLSTNIANGSNGTSGVTAVYGFDNMRYAGTLSGTKAQLLAAIGSASNWLGDNTTTYNFPSALANFTVASPPTLVSGTFADNALKIGETSNVTFVFSTAVSGFTTADLTVPNGAITGLGTSDGGTTWTGTFTPNASVTDATNVITVNLAGVTSISGSLAGSGTADSSNYAIDTQAPSVSSVSATTGNGHYVTGQTVDVTVTFDDNVTVTGTPQITLETGSTDQVANYLSGTGTNTLTFRYTVQAGDTSPDLDYLSTSALALNGGTIRDSAGNDATLTLASPGTAGSLGANKAIVIDSAPAIGNVNSDSVAWAGVGNTVVLDVGANGTLSDTEFAALNSGNGNWSGGTLAVQRSGTAISADVLGFNTSGALFTVSGSNLQSGGQTFATYTSTGGVLTVTFTSSGTAATTALVQDVLRHINYRNDTPAGDATLRFTLNDGYSTATADVTVTSDTIYITNTTDTATINLSDGVSISEAVAIAAADVTGSQTLVFGSNFNSTVSLAGALSINESLTLNADSASGLTISGGVTVTLGGGTTLDFTNSTGTVTIAATLGGSGSLSKSGAGTLYLSSISNEANMSGGITVNAGTLQISSDDHLSSGTLTLNGGTLTNFSSAMTIDNNIVIGSSGGTFTIGGGSGATSVVLSGVVSGSGTLNKNGQAILELSGNNTYTGATNIAAGTVLVSHANGLGTTAGSTTVADGATVRLAGGLTVAESFSIIGSGKTVSAVNYGALHLVSGSTTVSGTVTLTGAADISAASGAILTISGAMSGSFALNKTDSGTLILSNSGNEAGLTAGTTITAGTLSVADDDYLSSGTITLNGGTLALSGTTTIDNAIALASASTIATTANATLSGTVSGSGTLTKNGASTLTLSGSNTHSGAVNLTAGGLTLSGGSAIGDNSAITKSSGTTLTVSTNETIGSLAGSGNVVLNAGLITGGDNSNTTFSGIISGTGFGITKTGSGTFTLTGNNSYNGATTVSAGGLTLNRIGGALNDNTAVTVASGATLTLSADDTIDTLLGAGTVALGNKVLTVGVNGSSSNFSGAITGTGTLIQDGSGTLALSGANNSQSWSVQVYDGTLSVGAASNLATGAVQLNNGTLAITGDTTLNNALTLVGAGGTVSVASGKTANLAGRITGNAGLTKAGAGTAAIQYTSADNTTGAISVNAGTLQLDATTVGTMVVTSGGTLSGNGGIIDGALTINSGGTLAPGGVGATGTLTTTGNLTMNSGSTLAVDINGTTAGTGYDQIIVNGTVNVTNATLSANHAYSSGQGDTYRIIDNDLNDAITGTFSGLSEGATITASGNNTVLTATYIGGTGNDLILTAPVAPVVTDVSSATANATYKIGDTISITVTFDQAVTVNTTGGSPTLQLETGSVDRTATYTSGSGTTALTFSYTVQAGDTSADLDYLSTSAFALNGSTIRDALSNNANLTLASPGAAGSLGANKNIVVDGVRPTASIVVADTALSVGETSTVTITFNEAVTGLTTTDFIVANGVLSNLSSSDGGVTWTGTLTPSASTEDATNLITLDNTGVQDAAGNAGTGTTDSNNYAIDNIRPTASIVVTDTALKAGETSLVTITFSEAVTGLTTTDFTVANGVLSGLSSSDGGVTWTGTLTPTTSTEDATNLINLDNTGVQDAAGNTGSGTTDSNNYAIDTTRPTASIVVTDTALKAGETSLVTITFSEAVTGLTTTDFIVANGVLSNLSSSDGGVTWTGTLTPTASTEDATNLITLDNTGVQDAAGNAGTGTTDSNNYAIDTTRPTASIVVADTALKVGETSLVTITFSEAVTGLTTTDFIVANGVLSNLSSSDGGVTWTGTLTPSASTEDATNLITLDNTGVQDAAGNAGTGTTDSNNYAIDNIRPTASIVVADTALKAGETSLVTITFSEAVTGLTTTDFTVANGVLSGLSSSDGGVTWTGTLTPTTSTEDATNLINLDNTGVQDAAGNTGSGTTDSNNYAIDTTRPTASIVVTDTALKAGETSLVTITFSEAVTGLTTTDFIVANGLLSNLSSSDGGVTWTGTLTPTASTEDATNLITLDNTGVQDAAGNAGTGTTDSNNYAIDTLRPTASIVVADTALKVGETSGVTITFNAAVTGLTTADFTVANGVLSGLSSSDGGVTWTATLTPNASIQDTTNLVTLDNTGVQDAAGNAGTGTTDSNNYAIDNIRPTASIVVADTALKAGETSLVTITFSEAVTGLTTTDFTVANGVLSGLSSSDGGVTWTGTLTPTTSTEDATNLITLDNTGVQDAAGNAGTGTTDSNNYVIDTLRPTASIVVTDTALKAGETSLVTITFSEAVTGLTTTDFTVANGALSGLSSSDGGVNWTATLTPAVDVSDTTNLVTLDNTGIVDASGNTGTGTTDSNNYAIDTLRPTASIQVADNVLAIGETSLVTITFNEAVTGLTTADFTVANGVLSGLSSSDGGVTWTATLTPATAISDSTNVITLTNSGVTDAAGNSGAGTTDSNNYTVDTVRPTATIVVADTTLVAGETSSVTITFSEAITGLTLADFTVDNGTLSGLGSTDGGITWTATLTPTVNVSDTTNLITLDNSGIADTAGNSGTGTTDSNNFVVDTQSVPAVTSVTVPAGVLYNAGDNLGFTVNTTETVIVNTTGGTPRLALDIGGNTVYASYVAGSGTTTLIFQYTVQAGDNDADGIAITGLETNGGTLQSPWGSNLDITLNSVGATGGVRVDTVAPVGSGIVRVNASPTGASTVSYTATFSENVSGVDAADFGLVFTGTANGAIASVTQVDAHTYTLVVNNISGTGSIGLNLNSGSTGIIDAAGNAITGGLTGAVYAIDRDAPTVAGTAVPANGTYVAGQNLDFSVNLSEAVLVDTTQGVPRIAITLDSGTAYANYLSGSGTTTLVFRSVVAAGQLDTNGITLASSIDTNGGTIRDQAGNNVTTTLQNTAATAGILIDAVAPSVSSISIVGSPSPFAQSVGFTVVFSEAVTQVDASDFALTTTGSVSAAIGGLRQVDARTWTVVVDHISGSGSLRLDVKSGTDISDAAHNTSGGFTGGAVFTAATMPPAVPAAAPLPPVTSSAANEAPSQNQNVAPLIVIKPDSSQIAAPTNTSPLVTVEAPPLATATTSTVSTGSVTTSVSSLNNTPTSLDTSTPGSDPIGIVTATSTGNIGVAPGTSRLTSSGAYAPTGPAAGPTIDRLTSTAEAGLQGLPVIGKVDAQTGVPLYIPIPSAAPGTDPNQQLSVDVRMQDGKPLVSWLRFDPVTGSISGQAPKGFEGKLQLQITVRDAKGNSVSSIMELEFTDKSASDSQPAKQAPAKPLPAKPGAHFMGKPGLNDQFARYGKGTHPIDSDVLLGALKQIKTVPAVAAAGVSKA